MYIPSEGVGCIRGGSGGRASAVARRGDTEGIMQVAVSSISLAMQVR